MLKKSHIRHHYYTKDYKFYKNGDKKKFQTYTNYINISIKKEKIYIKRTGNENRNCNFEL